MYRKLLGLLVPALFLLIFINWSCSKIDTTELGSDLIPAVDNVHTFDTTLNINATQGLFTDSTRMASSDNFVLGSINNDPIFGTTAANLYLQFKPTFYPYYFGSVGDTLNGFGAGLDSVVLCLSYRGIFGDSTIPQHFSVYELNPSTSNFVDSAYLLNFQPDITPTNLIGQTTVSGSGLWNYTYFANHTDSANYQIRIKLSSSFANSFYNSDSAKNAPDNSFYTDSTFKLFHKGFAVVADKGMGGNGLFYVNLTDVNTRLEVHYRKRNKGVIDTTFTILPFVYTAGTTVGRSSHANYLLRDRSASEMQNSPQANVLYIQTNPGSYINLSIPSLTGFPNSIIHRAEIIAEQVPSSNQALDAILAPPNYLYIDLKDPANAYGFKPIYYDLSPYDSYDPDNATATYFLPASGINYSYYDGKIRKKLDGFGNTIAYYNFNVSRYVQNLVTKGTTNYELRLYAPSQLTYYGNTYSYNNNLAFGRLRIGSGSNPDYKLRMRIIYSKL